MFDARFRFRTHRRYNELSREEADGGDSAISKEGNGSERVDDCVDVSEPLEPLQLPAIGVPEWAVTTEEDLD